MTKPAKKTAAKKSPVAAKKPRTSAAAKPASSLGKSTASTARSSASRTTTAIYRTVISKEQIAVEAYYIAERRRKFHLPGDSKSDWLEAERRLKS